MDINVSIEQLGKELDEWFDSSASTFASQNRSAQLKALLQGIEIPKKLDRLKADGLAAMTALLDRRDAISEDERVASLVQAFIFGAKLWATLHDELLDADVLKVAQLMRDIVMKLEVFKPDRASLAALLDHHNDMVRVCAGEHLIDLIPERVVPVLDEIEKKGEAREANLRAGLVLFAWELKQKKRDGQTA